MTPRPEPLVDLGAARRLQRPGGEGRAVGLQQVVTLGHHRARILLLRGLCSTSAIPSASSTGGT